MKKVMEFLTIYLTDVFILIGILLITSATLICFGVGAFLYVLGIFLIVLGIVDISRIRG